MAFIHNIENMVEVVDADEDKTVRVEVLPL